MDTVANFFISAWSGVVGNVLFLGLLLIGGFFLRHLPRRKRLRRFFLKKKGQSVSILLSHIRVAPNGAVGVSGGTYSFASSAIPITEAQVAQRFKGAFLSPFPGLAGQPGLLSSILVNEFPVEVSPSPLPYSSLPTGTIIAVGSSAFNQASAWIENCLHPAAKFDANNTGIKFSSGASSQDSAVGFIVKCHDHENDRFAFYVAGPSEAATAAALKYLLESWSDLEVRYRNRDSFAVAVRAVSVQPLRGRIEFYGQ